MREEIITETERLYLRRLTEEDYNALCLMLKDETVMYVYAHAFSDDEAHEWLERQLKRYNEYGFGLWAVILKESEELIGQCGITMQDCPIGEASENEKKVPEIGYLFRKEYWHKGYATEAAIACRRYGFEVLGFDEIYSIIRDNNIPSIRVAERNGMERRGSFVKHYYGIDMPHIVFSVRNQNRKQD